MKIQNYEKANGVYGSILRNDCNSFDNSNISIMLLIYITGIAAFLIILLVAIFAIRKSRIKEDLRFEHEFIFIDCFVKNSKVNRDSFEAILEQMSKIVCYGKPQLRKMLRVRNDFRDKFKKFIDEREV